ncbi:MAG TPA: M3 family oligoendopeptidase [Acidimicrobiia bacterium]|nr:M3 family oligoendopeptidase [Acidimicrobiia bacterium]
MTVTATPPRWDLSPIFAGLDDRSFNNTLEGVYARVDRLAALYDEHGIGAIEPRPTTDADIAVLDQVLGETNDMQTDMRVVSAYLYALTTTDSRDDVAAARIVEMQTRTAAIGPLGKRLGSWLAALGVDAFVAKSETAAAHEYTLRKAVDNADFQMSEAEESLAAALAPSGSLAWQRLHGDVSSQLMVEVRGAGGSTERVPMAVARGLATHPDAATRRAAYDGELAAWDTVAVPLAAALNGAKGEAAVLNRRRGFADDLEPNLRANNVDRATVDAMNAAVIDSLPDFRRYLRAKAALLGHDRGLPWFDLLAPVGDAGEVSWPEATNLVRDAFAGFSPALLGLADRAFDEQWVDAEMRDGKRGGAYCVGVAKDVSRVMMNFDGSTDSVSTLAHELGHAFHNVALAERTPLQRRLPMALAETASIFCETLLFETAAAQATDPGLRLSLLDTHLTGAAQVVVDIHSRFLFETELCRRRARTALSVSELNAAMLAAQEASYGDGLDPEYRHAYMWAVKPHYYTPFYNWPYTFGLLFGLGLYARYVDDPDTFRAGYDNLLSTTGMADAAELTGRFGFDVRDKEFWASSLANLRGHIDEYVALAAAR